MTTIDTATEGTEVDDTTGTETPGDDPTMQEPASQDSDTGDENPDDDAETFPRSVVEKLRRENGKYRQRAGQAVEGLGVQRGNEQAERGKQQGAQK